jgi:membrane associated rhomboid family serine protease
MTPWVTRLIVANVIVFFLTRAVPGLLEALAYVPAYTATRPWTPFTYMFAHSPSIGHIIFNMLSLYFFGPMLEARLGSRHFLGLYLTGGLGGALFSLVGSWIGIFPPLAPIVGASGSVYAVMLAFARFWPRTRVLVYGIFPVEAWFLIIIMFVITLFGTAGFVQPGVAHLAHLGGAAGGFFYLLLAERNTAAAKFRARARPAPKPVAESDVERWKRIDPAAMHPVNREEFDRLMAKIAATGVASLTHDERLFLDRFMPAA